MIRRALPAEAPRLATLVEAAYAPWVPVIGRRPLPMQDDYAVRIAADQAWVLEADGSLRGLVVIETHADHLLLDNIAVDPAWHGAGHGRALLTFVEDEARRRGLLEVRLFTNALTERNITLYSRCGYAEVERRTERDFTRVLMVKRI